MLRKWNFGHISFKKCIWQLFGKVCVTEVSGSIKNKDYKLFLAFDVSSKSWTACPVTAQPWALSITLVSVLCVGAALPRQTLWAASIPDAQSDGIRVTGWWALLRSGLKHIWGPSSAFQCIWFLVASQLQFWMSQKFFLICIILLEACYQSDELHFYLPSMNSLKRALILSLLIAKEIQGAKSLWPLASAELWWSCWLGCILQHIHWVCSLLLGLGTCMALCELDWVQHKPVLQLQVASVNREHLQLSSLRIVWILQKLYFMKSSTF